MAKKKRKPDGEPPKPPDGPKPKSRPKKSGPRPKKAAPDPRAIEAMMWKMAGGPGAPPGDSPQAKAEALLHRAFDADDPAQVVKLARQALEVWPDCADAYVLLAEHARGPKEALDLYAQGVAAAERDIGAESFGELAGHFWGVLETRPYMRARLGLAQVLWVLGRRDEAVGHYREMLRLNPNDNQGLRYLLATCLIETGRDDELEALLKQYRGDGSASWAYGAALLAFRREGDSPRARKLLTAAKACNPLVPDFLTGREMLPSQMPPYVGHGDRNEAIDYAAGALNGWRATPGALAWLRLSDPRAGAAGKPKAARAKGPTPAVKKRLARLPQAADEVWQAEARRLPIWINVDAEPLRPWVILVASLTSDLILTQDVTEEPPSPGSLWDKLAKAMEKPSAGEPQRPTEVQVRPAEPWQALAPDLDELGVRVAVTDRLELIDDIMAKLVEHVCGRPPGPSLLDMPGVSPEQVARFFEAAAGFYRAAPWQRTGGEETIRIACDRFESGPWYAVVIGQMGMTLGVALYEDLDALIRMRDGDASDEQNARETVALSVTFGDQTEVPVADLEAAERHGWEVAGPDAYPAPIRKERGLVMRPPLGWELQLLEACLRAIPGFIASHDRDDPAPLVLEVPTAPGPLTLELSWVHR